MRLDDELERCTITHAVTAKFVVIKFFYEENFFQTSLLVSGLRSSSDGHWRCLRSLRQSLPHSGNERPEEVRDQGPQEDAQPVFQPGQMFKKMKPSFCIFTADEKVLFFYYLLKLFKYHLKSSAMSNKTAYHVKTCIVQKTARFIIWK